MAGSEEKLKGFLVGKEIEKLAEQQNIHKTKIMAYGPITSLQIDGEAMETVTDFILGGSKITADGDCSLKIKRRILLKRKTIVLTRQTFAGKVMSLLFNMLSKLVMTFLPSMTFITFLHFHNKV